MYVLPLSLSLSLSLSPLHGRVKEVDCKWNVWRQFRDDNTVVVLCLCIMHEKVATSTLHWNGGGRFFQATKT